jgi:lipopolysaccharide/colanic/teichoic acid biosynthesis glycosyltransferase
LLKRVIDVLAAASGLLVLLPVMAAISIAIRLQTRGPALYRGARVGKDGREFNIIKFRSMRLDAERLGGSSTSADDPRVTPIGAVLRRYKLDELPQLWNVLVGDMSLVGPRPQVPWAVRGYQPHERILLTVRPGITDPASLRFADEGELLRGSPDPDKTYFELIHPEKMRLSIDYVTNRTLWRDMTIILATLAAAAGWRPRIGRGNQKGTTQT